ncbi:MAG: hypothetical protein ORN54_12165 [Cyclobacteriaceae bacterium]|nr:hypothetical protein [Cyclobacteriaceae bacterium]
MKNFFLKVSAAVLLTSVIFISSCRDDAPALPDNLIQFESDQLGIGASEIELTISLSLSREASEDATAVVEVAATGVANNVDFTTDPATSTSNTITFNISKGALGLSFKLKKAADFFDGDDKIVFTLTTTPKSLVLGEKTRLSVSFSEIVATSSSIQINGGGPTYPNKVFIDLSANRQTAVARTKWDFGFSSSTDFRVTLNSSNGMMARVLDKTDLNAVTSADTVGFGIQQSMTSVFTGLNSVPKPDWLPTSINWIDAPSGDLTKTAIAEVSATASENKVYIVNLGDGPGIPATKLGWKKIRVLRNGSGYTLQHANIGATTFSEIQITKNTTFAFQYVSLTAGIVDVAPAKDKWDIAWSGFSNKFPSGDGYDVPYYFQDIVLQNTTGVQTVQIFNSTKSYDSFSESDLAALDLGTQSQLKIGSNWRSGGGPTSGPSIRTDRYYIVKDGQGNYYKLKFTALTTNGERGKPVCEFSLLRKGI